MECWQDVTWCICAQKSDPIAGHISSIDLNFYQPIVIMEMHYDAFQLLA